MTRAGPTNPGARALQQRLVRELRDRAARLGIQWLDVVKRAELGNATRDRLRKHNIAGAEVIGRIEAVLNEIEREQHPQSGTLSSVTPASAATAPVRKVESPKDYDDESPTIRRSRSDFVRRGRWVVVERRDGQICVGATTDTDQEIAARGHVVLDRCRRTVADVSAAILAAVGPGKRGILGPEAPSTLVLDVAFVYHATKGAIRAIEALK